MKRFRPRISIRWLMALVMILGVPLGWTIGRARAQRDAIAAIRPHGEAAYAGEFAEDDADLPGWQGAPTWLVRWLGRDWCCPITWASLDANATDADLAAVARFGQLRKLELAASRVTDDGLAHLSGLADLRTLFVHGGNVSDRVVAHLDLSGMRWLDLTDTAVTDATLATLRGCRELESLALDGTRITDDGLRDVADLSKLTYLSIGRTAVTDDGLDHLRRMKNLQTLWIVDSKISPEGVRKLCAAIPRLTVHRGL